MRRHPSRWIILVALAGSASVASAQPGVRDHRGEHRPPNAGPTEAPPPPRAENMAPRAGFMWIAGRWDWRGKWEWMPGHWEREHAGKRWRAGHWDHKDNSWAYVDGGWEAGPAEPPPTGTPLPPAPTGTLPPPPAGGPHEGPPPPREERYAARAGFVWMPGQWDWRNNKWEWLPGRWERERAGQKWRPTRWEQHDGAWTRVDGTWENIAVGEPPPGAPPPPPGEPPPPPEEHHRHEWRIDRPTVSSYWPAKGKAGTRVVIHGRNFPADAELMFANEPVHAAKVKPDEIVFEVPAGAPSGTIAVRAGHGRPMIVGDFEVAAGFDPVAEQKRLEDEQRKAAEAAWQARQKELARDRTARQEALDRRRAEREANRERRRADELAQIEAKWQRAFLADPDTQSELTLHAQRVAELARMAEMADLTANGKLAVRIQVLQTKEDARHQQRMAALQTSFQSKGGQP